MRNLCCYLHAKRLHEPLMLLFTRKAAPCITCALMYTQNGSMRHSCYYLHAKRLTCAIIIKILATHIAHYFYYFKFNIHAVNGLRASSSVLYAAHDHRYPVSNVDDLNFNFMASARSQSMVQNIKIARFYFWVRRPGLLNSSASRAVLRHHPRCPGPRLVPCL